MDEVEKQDFIERALAERDRWQSVLSDERDVYGAFGDLVTLYKQAILNPEQTLAEAIEQVWTAPDDD